MLDNVFYMYSNMDSSSQILIFLIILVGLMLVSILVINLITKKKNDKYNNKFHRVDKYSNYSKEKEQKRSILDVEKKDIKVVSTPKIEEKKSNFEVPKSFDELKNENKKTTYDKIEIFEPEIIEELDEPEVIEIISDEASVEKISDLIEGDINNPKPINLTKYEEDEERNAIISYDELVKRAGAKKIVYKTEPVKKEEIKERKEVKEDIKGKFRASQIISPIYGVQKETKEKEEFEEFIDVDNIPINNVRTYDDEELQKDITFLTNLKTFRSNLD